MAHRFLRWLAKHGPEWLVGPVLALLEAMSNNDAHILARMDKILNEIWDFHKHQIMDRLEIDINYKAYVLKSMTTSTFWHGKWWSLQIDAWVEWQRLKFDRDPFIYMKWISVLYFILCFVSNPLGVTQSVGGFLISSPLVRWAVVLWILCTSAVVAPYVWQVKKSYLSTYITPMRRTWGKMDFLTMLLNTAVRIANSYALYKALELVGAGMDPRLGTIVSETLTNPVMAILEFLSFELYILIPLWHYLMDLDEEKITEFVKKHQWKVALLGANVAIAFIIIAAYLFRDVHVPAITMPVMPVMPEVHFSAPAVHIAVPEFSWMLVVWIAAVLGLFIALGTYTCQLVSSGSSSYKSFRSSPVMDAIQATGEKIGELLSADSFWNKIWFAWRLTPTITAILFAVIVSARYYSVVHAASAEAPVQPITQTTAQPSETAITLTPAASATQAFVATATLTTSTPVASPTYTVTATPSSTPTATLSIEGTPDTTVPTGILASRMVSNCSKVDSSAVYWVNFDPAKSLCADGSGRFNLSGGGFYYITLKIEVNSDNTTGVARFTLDGNIPEGTMCTFNGEPFTTKNGFVNLTHTFRARFDCPSIGVSAIAWSTK